MRFRVCVLALALLGCGQTCPKGVDVQAACLDDPGAVDGGRCTEAQLARGTTCIARNLYVDSTLGSDDYEGSEARPFKTVRHGLASMLAGQTLNLKAGEYATAAGDTLDQLLPDGMTLQGLPTGEAAVVLRANTREALTALGSVTIRDVVLEDFLVPLAAGDGQQLLERVVVRNARGAMLLIGRAQLTCRHCTFSNALSNRDRMILARGVATLHLDNTRIVGGPGDCIRGSNLVGVVDHATASFDDVELTAAATYGVVFDSRGKLTIRRSQLSSTCAGSNAAIFGAEAGQELEASVLLEDSTFHAGVRMVSRFKSVRVRRSTFVGMPFGVALAGMGARADLGRPPAEGEAGEAGENTIRGERAGLLVDSDDILIDAAGNTWTPNEQGADADGRYPARRTFSDASPAESGKNISFSNVGSGPISKVHL